MKPRSPTPMGASNPNSLGLDPAKSSHESSSRQSLTITVRYLPTDEWITVQAAVGWTCLDLKRRILVDQQTQQQQSLRQTTQHPGQDNNVRGFRGKASEKENHPQARQQRKEDRESVRTPIAGHGVRRLASALRDRLSTKEQYVDSNAGPSPSRSSASLSTPVTPFSSSTSRGVSLSATSTPTKHELELPAFSASFLQFDRNGTHQEIPSPVPRSARSSESHSRRSSMAFFNPTDVFLSNSSTQQEAYAQRNDTSPVMDGRGRRMERSKSLTERPLESNVQVETSIDSERTPEENVEHQAASWVLVSVITGAALPDYATLENKLVDNDILTLKPYHLPFDPPLHLYHLPYLHLASALVLPASLSTCHCASGSHTKGHARRRSFGGKQAKEDLVTRRIEIGIDDGFFCEATMILRVIKGSRLEAIYPLPSDSIRLVSSGAASSSSSPIPSLPTSLMPTSTMTSSASVNSLSTYVLPGGPTWLSSASSRSHSPTPSSSSPFSTPWKKSPTARALPLIQLDWHDGQTLSLKAKSEREHKLLMKLLGESDNGDERDEDEAESQRRKDLLDLAFASRHRLLPTCQSRVQANVPRSGSSQTRQLQTVTIPDRRSSILHIQKMDDSRKQGGRQEVPDPSSNHDRTSSTNSMSTYSSAPTTPTSLHDFSFASSSGNPDCFDTATPSKSKGSSQFIVTPATPSSSSVSPKTSPASLISSSSSYFSPDAPQLVLPPFSASTVARPLAAYRERAEPVAKISSPRSPLSLLQ